MFKAENITKVKEDHWLLSKGSVYVERIKILNLCVHNTVPKNIMQNGQNWKEIDKSTIIKRDLNPPFSLINWSKGWKDKKDMKDLTKTNNKLEPADIFCSQRMLIFIKTYREHLWN